MIGLIGKKIGMTRIFSDDGTSCQLQLLIFRKIRFHKSKHLKSDGYSAIQVAYGSKSKHKVPKAIKTHLSKAKLESCLFMKEFRVDKSDESNYSVGQSFKS